MWYSYILCDYYYAFLDLDMSPKLPWFDLLWGIFDWEGFVIVVDEMLVEVWALNGLRWFIFYSLLQCYDFVWSKYHIKWLKFDTPLSPLRDKSQLDNPLLIFFRNAGKCLLLVGPTFEPLTKRPQPRGI